MATKEGKQRRGFGAMDPAKQKEIASRGGRASHEKGTGHEWDADAARAAGSKGGKASHARRVERAAAEAPKETPASPSTR